MNRTATKLTEETRDGKTIYCVQWPKFPKGRNRQYFKEKIEAETFLKQKLTEQKNYGDEGAAFSLRQRVEYLECADKLAPFNATLRDAINFYLPHLEATNRTCTAAELVAELLKTKKADGASARYLGDLRSRLTQFATSFNGKAVAEITAAEVDQWLRSRSDSGTGNPLAATTRNNFRRVLIAAFNFARERGYCVGNPAAKSAKAKVVEAAAGILTVEEMSRLLENADEDLVPISQLARSPG
jgi:hypothetical protein